MPSGSTASRILQVGLGFSCGSTASFTATLATTAISPRECWELKIDVGPGYRVYYNFRGDQLLLLLAGGTKASQPKDIAKAMQLNRTFQGESQ
jgi:hypothetical protein